MQKYNNLTASFLGGKPIWKRDMEMEVMRSEKKRRRFYCCERAKRIGHDWIFSSIVKEVLRQEIPVLTFFDSLVIFCGAPNLHETQLFLCFRFKATVLFENGHHPCAFSCRPTVSFFGIIHTWFSKCLNKYHKFITTNFISCDIISWYC